jgi:hypothetical protein
MADPPEVDEGPSLVQTLMDPAPSEVFSFKRRTPDGEEIDFPIRIRLLRIEETHGVLIAAQKYARSRGELPKEYADVYQEAQICELLALALCRVEKHERSDGTIFYPPMFSTSKQLRASLHEGEAALLLNMYEVVKSTYGSLESFDEVETERWIARLADPMRRSFFLSALDSAAWPDLLFAMAQTAAGAFQTLGLTLPPLLDTLESDPETSEPGTTDSSGPRSVRCLSNSDLDGLSLSTTEVLDREQARVLVRQKKKRRKKKR